MAISALLSAQTTDATGTGVATTASPAYIEIPNDSVFKGAQINIQAASVNTAGKFSPLSSPIGSIHQPGWYTLDLPTGTFVRAVQSRSATGTSITVNLSPTA